MLVAMDRSVTMPSRRRLWLVLVAILLTAPMAWFATPPADAARPTCDGKVATKVGTNRAETIIGTRRDDVIVARGGNDTVRGRGGKDRICGGAGDDDLFGDRGRDRLFGQAGDDRLDGGSRTDTCVQGAGTGPRVRCELPPVVHQVAIGGPRSGQIGQGFDTVSRVNWDASVDCRTGHADRIEWRATLEFPLGLPAGALIERVRLSISIETQGPEQSLRAAVGDGALDPSDAVITGTPIFFTPTTNGYHTVDVTSIFTPGMVAAGWVTFLLRREPLAPNVQNDWQCFPLDLQHPILRIDYTLP